MTRPGRSTVDHELIDRYLDDLARMLDGADPQVRAEVLGGVREHVDASLGSLGREPTDSDVWRVLGDLGPPEAVAAEALGDRVTTPGDDRSARDAGHTAPPEREPVPFLARGWVPLALILLLLLATLNILLLALGTPAGMLGSTLIMALPLYLPAAVVVLASPLWRWPAKLVALAVPWVLPLGLIVAADMGLVQDDELGVPWYVVLALLTATTIAWLGWVYSSGQRAWREGTWRGR